MLALVGVCYWLVWPVGPYAILDDWAFNVSLRNFHERGVLRVLDWNPMSLVGHLLWGELFVRLFGMSFTVTKLSVVAMHAIECVVLMRWLRWCGVGTAGAVMALLALMFHPLHFQMCYSYDTDITALVTQFAGMALIARGLSAEPALFRSLLAGSLMIGWSFCTRQHGATALLAVGSYLVLWDRRRLFGATGIVALAPAAVMMGTFWAWYQFVHLPTATFTASSQRMLAFFQQPPWADLPMIVLTYAVYLGSFVMAAAVALPLSTWRSMAPPAKWIAGSFAAGLLALIFTLYVRDNVLFPYLWNTVTPYGLYGIDEYLLGSRPVLWGEPLAWVITLVCTAGIVAFGASLLNAATAQYAGPRQLSIRLVGLWLAWQCVYVAATTLVLFDRHLIILAPTSLLLMFLLNGGPTRWGRLRFALILLPIAFYSVAGTHDVHSESRLAFAAGEELIASGVKPWKINGGYAFDSWQLYEKSLRNFRRTREIPKWWESRPWNRLPADGDAAATRVNTPSSSWWFRTLRVVDPCDYVISLSLPDGPGAERPVHFHEMKRYPYTSAWTGGTKFVYVLERTLGT